MNVLIQYTTVWYVNVSWIFVSVLYSLSFTPVPVTLCMESTFDMPWVSVLIVRVLPLFQ